MISQKDGEDLQDRKKNEAWGVRNQIRNMNVSKGVLYECFSFLGALSLDLGKDHIWCILGDILDLHRAA